MGEFIPYFIRNEKLKAEIADKKGTLSFARKLNLVLIILIILIALGGFILRNMSIQKLTQANDLLDQAAASATDIIFEAKQTANTITSQGGS